MTYYDLPLLKPAVWTWEVPAYFFVGGAAGAAATLAGMAQLSGEDWELVRDARWIAAIGAGLSAPLLIADLGRPERFLNMLRVFKPQSPMSVGAWTVAVFGAASTAAVIAPGKPLRDLSAAVAAVTGMSMSTYTGVLLGATAIPVWKEHVRVLPAHFAASALGSAVSLLELRGHGSAALNALGIGAALFECAAGFSLAGRDGVASAFSGPLPLILRLFGKRKAAAAAAIAGSLLTRYAWVAAGKASAANAHAALTRKPQ